MSRRLDQVDEDSLLGPGARYSINGLVKRPVGLALGDFEEVAHIEGVIARPVRIDDGRLCVIRRGVSP